MLSMGSSGLDTDQTISTEGVNWTVLLILVAEQSVLFQDVAVLERQLASAPVSLAQFASAHYKAVSALPCHVPPVHDAPFDPLPPAVALRFPLLLLAFLVPP